jgi:hypothetical protein
MGALVRVAVGVAVIGASAVHGQGLVVPPRATVTGAVTDLAGRPLAGAEVLLLAGDTVASESQAGVRTGDGGRFALSGSIQRRNWLRVSLPGYESRAVELFFPRDSTRPLSIELQRAVSDSARSEDGDSVLADPGLEEFLERQRTNALGHFYTRKQILARQPQYLSELLRSLPGVVVNTSRSGGYTLRMRGCRYAPVVWIDRTRAQGIELDEVARVDEVAALEVYTGPAGVPAQYLDRSNVGCGTVLVWSRQ